MATTELPTRNEIAPRNGHAGSMPAVITEEHRAILRSMVDRNATPTQVEMLIVIGNRYHLDPLLGHIVLITGKVFVTHKGLLHAAHASKMFDGMETDFGRDAAGDFAECRVWRKDMNRPFKSKIYIQEYRNNNPVWKQHPHAMAAKAVESFVLRRAFDVSLTSAEEMGVYGEQEARHEAIPDEESRQEAAERQTLWDNITALLKQLPDEQLSAFRMEYRGVKVRELPLPQLARVEVELRECLAPRNVIEADAAPVMEEDAEDDPFDEVAEQSGD